MLRTQSKGVLSPEEKKEKLAQARTFHTPLLNHYGARDVDFNFKSQFTNKGFKVIALYPSELIKTNGFFIELIDSNLNPIDPKRTVYRMNAVENYEDVYEMLQTGAYAVPMEELEVVKIEEKVSAPKFEVDMGSLNKVEDANISNMTITDFAAIMWMKPVSEKVWLNNLILQNIVE